MDLQILGRARDAERPRRGGWARLAALCTGLGVLAAMPAQASDGNLFFEDGASLLQGYSVMGGAFVEGGGGELSGWKYDHPLRPTGYGFRYYERNGFITGTIAAIAIAVGGGMAAAGPKRVETWESGGYRYTRTTYYSPAEKAAMAAATSAAAAGAFGSANQSFDLEIYTRQMGGNSEGWRVNGMLFGVPFADGQGMFDMGFGYANVKSAIGESGKYLISNYHYLGMPMRLSYAFGPFVTYAHFEWNWLGHSDSTDYNSKNNQTQGTVNGKPVSSALTEIHTTGFPWRFGVQAALISRLYLEAALVTPNLTSGSFGGHATIGARF